MFHIPRINQTHNIYLRNHLVKFGFVNVLLYSDDRHVASHVAIPTHYICVCIRALTILKMATRVAEACRRSLYNKITFINRSSLFWSF
jgi:hypothetical protein